MNKTAGAPPSRKKATKWEIIFYYSQLAISITRGFLIVPFYLILLDHQVYGAWLASGNILGWIQMFDPGTGNILKQRISQESGKNDKESLGLHIASGLTISGVVSFFVLISGLVATAFLIRIIDVDFNIAQSYELTSAFRIAVIGTTLSVLNFSIVAINKGFLQTRPSNIIILLSSIVGLAVNITLLSLGYGLISIAFGILTNGALSLLGNLVILRRIIKREEIKLALNMSFFKSFSTLFSYNFLAKMGVVLVEKSDLIIISRILGPEIVMSYELTRRPIRMAFDLLNKGSVSLMPAISNLYGQLKLDKILQNIKKFGSLYVWSSGLIAIMLILFNQSLITLWLKDTDYFIGYGLNTLLVVAILLRSIYYNMSNFTFSLGNIKGNSIIIFAKSIVYLLLLFILVEKFMLLGAILSIFIATLLVESWYYPSMLKSILKYTTTINLRHLYKAIPYILLLIIIVSGKEIFADSWLNLLIKSGIVLSSYFIIIFLIDKEFRLAIIKQIPQNSRSNL